MGTDIAMAVWPLYFVLALGFLAGKWGGFSPDAAKELNQLAMSCALPAMLFVSTATLSRGVLIQELPALAAVLVSYLGMFLFTVIIVHLGFKRTLPDAAIAGVCAASPRRAALTLCAARYNNGATAAVMGISRTVGPARRRASCRARARASVVATRNAAQP